MKVLDVDFGVAMLRVLLGPHDKTLLSTDTSNLNLLNLETKDDRPEKTENPRLVSVVHVGRVDAHQTDALGRDESKSDGRIFEHLRLALW